MTYEITGFSPNELVHDKKLRISHISVYENWTEKETVEQYVVHYILNLTNRLKHCDELKCKKRKRVRKRENNDMITMWCIEN